MYDIQINIKLLDQFLQSNEKQNRQIIDQMTGEWKYIQ